MASRTTDIDVYIATDTDEEHGMHIDCDSCEVRGLACDDCVVSVLLGRPEHDVALDATDQGALHVLATSGLVPPLRMQEAATRQRDSA